MPHNTQGLALRTGFLETPCLRSTAPTQAAGVGESPAGRLPGDHTCGETPVPIPNTAVKPARPMIVPQARKSVIAGSFQKQAAPSSRGGGLLRFAPTAKQPCGHSRIQSRAADRESPAEIGVPMDTRWRRSPFRPGAGGDFRSLPRNTAEPGRAFDFCRAVREVAFGTEIEVERAPAVPVKEAESVSTLERDTSEHGR